MNKQNGSVQLIIAGVLALALLGGGGFLGYRFMDGEVQKHKAIALEMSQRALKWQEARDREKIVVKTITKLGEKQVQTITEFVEVVKNIPSELSCEKDSSGTGYLPAAWRVSHDAAVAAANDTPQTVYDKEHPPQGVTARGALETVVSNYAICAKNAILYDAAADYIMESYDREVKALESSGKTK